MQMRNRKVRNLFDESEMDTITAAVRLLSNHGMLNIVVGENVFPAKKNMCRVGPLTSATNRKTGENVWLWADSMIPVRPDELAFTLELKTKKAKKKNEIKPNWMHEHMDEVADALGVREEFDKLNKPDEDKK
jgi:hypothetical protein